MFQLQTKTKPDEKSLHSFYKNLSLSIVSFQMYKKIKYGQTSAIKAEISSKAPSSG